MLFPNSLDQNNAVSAGQTLRLPRPTWMVKAGGPAGKNHLLAIVTESPRDFSQAGLRPAGPFSIVAASNTASKDIQRAMSRSANAGSKDCDTAPADRTLTVQRKCSDAYGAAMMVVEEVP